MLNNLFSIYTRPFSINFYLRIWVTDRRVSTPLLLRAALLIFLSVQCFLKMSSHDEISRNTRRQQRWPRSIPDIAIFLYPFPPPQGALACCNDELIKNVTRPMCLKVSSEIPLSNGSLIKKYLRHRLRQVFRGISRNRLQALSDRRSNFSKIKIFEIRIIFKDSRFYYYLLLLFTFFLFFNIW